jgi:integrase
LQIGTAKTFHSFRHTIRTELVEIGIDSGLIDSMIGHSSAKRSVGDTEYTHTDRLAQKRDANAKVDFGVDITSITHWTKCVFASKFL